MKQKIKISELITQFKQKSILVGPIIMTNIPVNSTETVYSFLTSKKDLGTGEFMADSVLRDELRKITLDSYNKYVFEKFQVSVPDSSINFDPEKIKNYLTICCIKTN